MTNEELATRIKNGETELMATLWEQVEKYIRMSAEKLARKLVNKAAVDAEDFVQAGYFALMDAVKYYREDIGCSFIGVLNNCLKTAFAEVGGWRTANGKAMWENPPKSLNEPIGYDDEGNELTLCDVLACPCNDFAAVEECVYNTQLHNVIEEALAEIPENEADAVRSTYLEGKTLSIRAAELGVSANLIQQRKSKGLRMLAKNKKLQNFYYSDSAVAAAGMRGTGVKSFRNTGSSATERAAINMAMGKPI